LTRFKQVDAADSDERDFPIGLVKKARRLAGPSFAGSHGYFCCASGCFSTGFGLAWVCCWGVAGAGLFGAGLAGCCGFDMTIPFF
jgi:hypothetical protein